MALQQEQAEGVTIGVLQHIIRSTRKNCAPLPGYGPTLLGLHRETLGIDCDEVHTNLLVGNMGAAKSLPYLQLTDVSLVLNVADVCCAGFANVTANDFIASLIDNCIRSRGKVLVICRRGMSRSPTIAISYLIIKLGIPATTAFRIICQKRKIDPNIGFLQQLCNLENSIQRNVNNQN